MIRFFGFWWDSSDFSSLSSQLESWDRFLFRFLSKACFCYRVFIKYCVFSLKFCDFSELCQFCCSAGFLPAWCVYTHWHRGKTGKGQSQKYFKILGKNTIFNEHPVCKNLMPLFWSAYIKFKEDFYHLALLLLAASSYYFLTVETVMIWKFDLFLNMRIDEVLNLFVKGKNLVFPISFFFFQSFRANIITQ